MRVRQGFLLLFAAAIIAGCAGAQNYGIQSPVVLLNSQLNTMTMNFASLGTQQTVSVSATNGDASTVFTATPGSGCAGVASIAGSTNATTSTGNGSTFTVTGLTVAPSGTCTIAISSSTSALAATLQVNTQPVPTAAPTGITIH